MSNNARTISGLETVNCDLLTAVRAEIETLIVDDVTVNTLTITTLTVTDLDVTGTATIDSLVLTDLEVVNLTVTGTATLPSLSFTNLDLTGYLTVAGLTTLNNDVTQSRTVDAASTFAIRNASSGSNAYSIFEIRNDGVSSGVLFKNSSTRASDGGVNVMTLRNDNANLRFMSGFNPAVTISFSGGDFQIGSTTASTTTTTGSLTAGGGAGIAGAGNFGGAIKTFSTTASTSTTTGSLIAGGGAGVAGAGNFGGVLKTFDTTASTSATTGSLIAGGGAGVAGAGNFGGVLKTFDTTASTSATTGSLIAGGGAGVAGAGNFGGVLKTFDTTASTSTTTGSLIAGGGAGIAGAIYGGDLLNILSTGTFGDNSSVTASKNGTLIMAVNNSSNGASANSLFHAINDSGSGLAIFINSSTKSTDGGANTATVRNDVGDLRLMAGTGLVTVDYNTGDTVIESTTQASSVSVAALVSKGGLGVAGKAYIGDTLTIPDLNASLLATFTGNLLVSFNTNSVSGPTIRNVNAGSSAGSILYLQTDSANYGVIFKNSTTKSSDGGVDAMTVRNDGGKLRLMAGTGEVVINYNTGDTVIESTTQASSVSVAALVSKGGLGVAGKAFIGDTLTIPDLHFTTTATSFTPTIQSDITVTYTTQTGRYLIFGPLTYIEVYIVTTSALHSTGTDLLIVLPGAITSPFVSGLIPQSGPPTLESYALPSSTDSLITRWLFDKLAIYATRDNLTGQYLQSPTSAATRTIGFSGWFYNL